MKKGSVSLNSKLRRETLWQVAVLTSKEAEDAVMELLQSLLGVEPSSYLDLDVGSVEVSGYAALGRERKLDLKRALRHGLNRIRNCGLEAGPLRCSIKRVRRENWAESWKKHFKPIEVGTALLLKPAWSRRRPRQGQVAVTLNPGLSFGTGQHPTTAFCLKQLVEARNRASIQSFLDIGTGSGILAIAAAKLGYAPVHALDNDPEAVRVASSNARMNRVERKVRISRADITKGAPNSVRRYSVVCANLITPLLEKEFRRIASRLQAGGLLVLAGILRDEFESVKEIYQSAGLKLICSSEQAEWRSGAFQAQA